MSKYANEPPLTDADRAKARKKAINYKPIHALTVVCHGEADQIDLFPKLTKWAKGRKVKVIVS